MNEKTRPRPRPYGLFERTEDGRWVRLPGPALTKPSAVRFYQNALLDGAFGRTRERRLAPLKRDAEALDLR